MQKPATLPTIALDGKSITEDTTDARNRLAFNERTSGRPSRPPHRRLFALWATMMPAARHLASTRRFGYQALEDAGRAGECSGHASRNGHDQRLCADGGAHRVSVGLAVGQRGKPW